jgi:hypothetical protein
MAGESVSAGVQAVRANAPTAAAMSPVRMTILRAIARTVSVRSNGRFRR